MYTGKGKKQVQLTMTEEAYNRLKELAEKADRTLAGYLRWVFYKYLKELDKNERGEDDE